MTKDECAEERAAREKLQGWLRELEAAAAEIVEVGRPRHSAWRRS
jgi:hypothetical protein